MATGVATALAVMLSVAVAGPSTGAILGPVLAGVAAIAIAMVVRSMSAVSESRRQLIDELVRTRGLLAESERQAGIITERGVCAATEEGLAYLYPERRKAA